MQRSRFALTIALFYVGLLLLMLLPAFAQDNRPASLVIGEESSGQITVPAQSARFILRIGESQTLTIHVSGESSGVAPAFQLSDPAGVVLQSVKNESLGLTATATVDFSSSGAYTIAVSSANGLTGAFTISVGVGSPPPPPIPLEMGSLTSGSVDPEIPLLQYGFSASTELALLLTLRSDLGALGPIVTLKYQPTGEVIAVSNMRLIGVQHMIPMSAEPYILEVMHSGSEFAESFTICLHPDGDFPGCVETASAGGTLPLSSPPISASNCLAASATGASVNVRKTPTMNAGVVAVLAGNIDVQVLGRSFDSSWWQINVDGIVGWVAAAVIQTGGNCEIIPSATPRPFVSSSNEEESVDVTPSGGNASGGGATPIPGGGNPPATPEPAASPVVNPTQPPAATAVPPTGAPPTAVPTTGSGGGGLLDPILTLLPPLGN